MNIGMLWFDNDPKAGLDLKIERAANYYRQKYGRTPELCFIHPTMLPSPLPAAQDQKLVSGDIEVRGNRAVLPHHFWIGVHTG